MAAPRYWMDWLPAELRDRARREEPLRFKAAVRGLCAELAAARAAGGAHGDWAGALRWLDATSRLVSSKTQFDRADVVALCEALYAAVLAAAADVEAQVRLGELLCGVLRHHRHETTLGLRLPWRPLYELLRELFAGREPQLQGALLEHARHSTLFTLVTRCRRWFAPTAPAEIWAELQPGFSGRPGSAAAFEALGWLVLFMPTKALPAADALAPGCVAAWVAEWAALWAGVAHAPFWDSHWLYLLARVAKDDWRGVVDWSPHLPALYTRLLWAFPVPVGTASATPPISLATPNRAALLFGGCVDQVDDCSKSAAKLALHLLKQPEGAAAAAPAAEGAGGGGGDERDGAEPGEERPSAGAATALERLELLVALVEQYAHPSNTGAWSGDLALFLRQGVHYFMKQLARQGGGRGYEEAGGYAGAAADAAAGGAAAGGGAAAARPRTRWVGAWRDEARIVPAVQRRFVRAMLKLATRGQFSKKDSLVSASCKALSALSFVWPEQVVPLVVARFREAMDTVTATHQLPASITALAMCTRPMLLAGWAPAEERAPQLLAEAMMAVLPGIDANDEAKTAAVFQFYTAVLASVPALTDAADDPAGGQDTAGADAAAAQLGEPEREAAAAAAAGEAANPLVRLESGEFGASLGSPRAGAAAAAAAAGGGAGAGAFAGSTGAGAAPAPYRLPLYLQDWADLVLERVFTLLANLDSGPGALQDSMAAKPDLLAQQSGPLGRGESLYSTFFGYLLLRLPPALGGHVVQQLARYGLGSALPSVVGEAAVMFGCAAKFYPAAVVEQFVRPMAARLLAELPAAAAAAAAAGGALGRAQEGALTWGLVLLGGCVGALGASHALPLVPELRELVERGMRAPSRAVHNYSSLLLTTLLRALSAPVLPMHALAARPPPLLAGGLCAWVDKAGTAFEPPEWESPGPAHLAAAAELVDEFLERGGQRLLALVREGAGGSGAAGEERARWRNAVQARLACMSAVALGLMSSLRDFEPLEAAAAGGGGAGAGADGGTPLHVVGAWRPKVGAPRARERAAGVLAVAVRHLRGTDRELCEVALGCAMMFLCNGMGEGLSMEQQSPALSREDAAILAEPPVSANARGFGGAWPYRRRVPLMSALDRLRRMVVWRAHQEASYGFVREGHLSVPSLADMPREFVALTAEVVQAGLSPYAGMRSLAFSALASALKRLPVALAPALMSPVLAALAGVEPPRGAAPPPAAAPRPSRRRRPRWCCWRRRSSATRSTTARCATR